MERKAAPAVSGLVRGPDGSHIAPHPSDTRGAGALARQFHGRLSVHSDAREESRRAIPVAAERRRYAELNTCRHLSPKQNAAVAEAMERRYQRRRSDPGAMATAGTPLPAGTPPPAEPPPPIRNIAPPPAAPPPAPSSPLKPPPITALQPSAGRCRPAQRDRRGQAARRRSSPVGRRRRRRRWRAVGCSTRSRRGNRSSTSNRRGQGVELGDDGARRPPQRAAAQAAEGGGHGVERRRRRRRCSGRATRTVRTPSRSRVAPQARDVGAGIWQKRYFVLQRSHLSYFSQHPPPRAPRGARARGGAAR